MRYDLLLTVIYLIYVLILSFIIIFKLKGKKGKEEVRD